MSGMEFVRAAAMLTVAAVLCPAGETRDAHIVQRVELQAGKENRTALREFGEFLTAYKAAMRDRVASGPVWDFIVDLRPDPKHGNRPHILVVATRGSLMVRVADVSCRVESDMRERARAAADASVRVIQDRRWADVERAARHSRADLRAENSGQ